MPADTTTPNLGLLLMATGNDDNTWGDNLNQQVITLIENAISAIASVSTTGGTTVLSAAQYRPPIIDITGTLASAAIIQLPNIPKRWVVRNSTAGTFPVSVKTAAGAALNVRPGVSEEIFCDGSNVLTKKSRSGEIFDFAGVFPPLDSYECDGTAYSRTFDADLFNAITIQTTGGVNNASPVLTSIPSTSGMAPGMAISGAGIPTGATIASIQSGTAIVLSANMTATATNVPIVVAPWGVGDGLTTFNVPNFLSRFRRGRSNSQNLFNGLLQAADIGAHTHPATGGTTIATSTTDSQGGHNHGGATGNDSPDHTHDTAGVPFSTFNVAGGATSVTSSSTHAVTSGGASARHTHTIGSDGVHSHTVNFGLITTTVSVNNNTGTETRPTNASVLMCIRR